MTSRTGRLAACSALAASVALAGAVTVTEPRPEAVIIVAGETNGKLTPCGCSEPMMGGMPRRATAIGRLRSGRQAVLVDQGDLTPAAGRQDEIKAEAAVEMIGAMGARIWNLGERDLLLGPAYLSSLKARFPGKVLAGNLQTADGGAVGGLTATVVLAGGKSAVRVGFVGVLDEALGASSAASAGFKLTPAADAASRGRAALTGYAYRVLLYHGPAERGATVARSAGGFDLVVTAHSTEAVGHNDGIRTLCAGSDGKAIAWAGLKAGAPGGVVRLGPTIPEDAVQRRIHAAYVRRVRDEGLADQLPRMPLPPGSGYVGSAACSTCHAAAHRAWSSSRHADALSALRKTGQETDPECLPCHVVGLYSVGGYAPGEKSELARVGCENCHGPGKAHAADAKMPMRPGAMASCAACHVPEHSPRFNREAYWSRIRH